MKIRNNTQEINKPTGNIVYYLTDNNGEVLYVGKTTNIFSRIASHFYEKKFSRVFYQECKNEQEAEKLEVEEIIKYRPKYNAIIEKPHLAGYINKKTLVEFMRTNKIKIYNFPAFVIRENIEVIATKNAVYYKEDIKNIVLEKGKKRK